MAKLHVPIPMLVKGRPQTLENIGSRKFGGAKAKEYGMRLALRSLVSKWVPLILVKNVHVQLEHEGFKP